MPESEVELKDFSDVSLPRSPSRGSSEMETDKQGSVLEIFVNWTFMPKMKSFNLLIFLWFMFHF